MKKQIMLLCLILCAICGVCTACRDVGDYVPAFEADLSGTPQPTSQIDLPIHVTTLDEFLAAIGPDREIIIDGNGFEISPELAAAGDAPGNYYEWYEEPDGPELHIINTDNLLIRGGTESGGTKLIVSPRYASALNFYECTNISVENLTLGHSDGAFCIGSSIRFERCTGVNIKGAHLFGCGAYGFWVNECKDISVTDTEIYNCTSAAILAANSSSIIFNRCIIRDNASFSILDISTTTSFSDIVFKDCIFSGNYTSEVDLPSEEAFIMWWIKDGFTADVHFEDCIFKKNGFSVFSDEKPVPGKMTFTDCIFEYNAFETSPGEYEAGTETKYASVTEDEFRTFVESRKLSGLFSEDLQMTDDDKARFIMYFNKFDSIEREYILLLLREIANGNITDFDDYNSYEHGRYLETCRFYLYDMNGDGFPEFILKSGSSEAEFWYTVFTIVDGELIKCGGISGGHAQLFGNGSGNILRYEGHMSFYDITISELKGTKLETSEIASGEIGYYEDYPELNIYGYGDYTEELDFYSNGVNWLNILLAPEG